MSSSQTRGSTSVSWTIHGVAWQPDHDVTTSVQTAPVWSESQGSTFLEIVPDNFDRNAYRVLLKLLYNRGRLGNGFPS